MFINMVLDALVTSVTNAFSFDKFLKFNKNTIFMNSIYVFQNITWRCGNAREERQNIGGYGQLGYGVFNLRVQN